MSGDVTAESVGLFIGANRLPSVVEFSDEVNISLISTQYFTHFMISVYFFGHINTNVFFL